MLASESSRKSAVQLNSKSKSCANRQKQTLPTRPNPQKERKQTTIPSKKATKVFMMPQRR
jgi:hypothetical protein